MIHGFNDDKTKAKMPGFFGGELLNEDDPAVVEGIDTRNTSSYSVKNDCYLIVEVIDGSGSSVGISIGNSSIFYNIASGGTQDSLARNFGPVPVKKGTVIRFSGQALVFIFEYKLVY